VKVQHNWLIEECPLDLFLTEFSLNAGKLLFKDFNYDFLVTDIKKSIPQELNFKVEAQNAIQIKELFKNEKNIKVPAIYSELSGVGSRSADESPGDGVRQRDQHRQQRSDAEGRHQRERSQQPARALFREADLRVRRSLG
jgi:predicted unusual protein kinase regulating ubiquinone biosynthesis (AarF/ABC1/UbiB family)